MTTVRLGGSPRGVSTHARICFFTKGGAVPSQTRGDILVGYMGLDDDNGSTFDGVLYRPAEAFSRLYDYYTALRANHSELLLRIVPLETKPVIMPAIESPQIAPNQKVLEDYILQTL